MVNLLGLQLIKLYSLWACYGNIATKGWSDHCKNGGGIITTYLLTYHSLYRSYGFPDNIQFIITATYIAIVPLILVKQALAVVMQLTVVHTEIFFTDIIY